MKIFVAIPTYDGKLQIEIVKSLIEETIFASLVGDELHFRFLPSCGVPAAGRIQLVNDFMKTTDCDKLFFLDADVTFEAGSLVKIAHHPVDLVGGAYRFKTASEEYPVTWLKGEELWSDKDGLIEVETLPTGFLCISRNVFEKFEEHFPNRFYPYCGRTDYCYFQMIYREGHLFSEDTHFCREWREAGGKVFLDPEVGLTHWASLPTPYPGHIGNFLKNRTLEKIA